MPTRNWHKCSGIRVVANFLNVGADFIYSCLISLLAVGWLGGIHSVNTNHQLFHTQHVSQKGFLTGLSICGDTCSKFADTSSSYQDSTVSPDVPVILFLIKSLCPGASMVVTEGLLVSNFHREVSMVIPRSCLAFSLCKTQACLKGPFPVSAASSKCWMIRLSLPPHL